VAPSALRSARAASCWHCFRSRAAGLAGLAGRLANPNFAGKAPPEVVAECQANLAEAQAQAELVRGRLGELG